MKNKFLTLWNTRELSERLSAGTLSEKEKMHYFLLQALLVVVGTAKVVNYSPIRPIFYDHIGDVLVFLITLVGILLVYKQNERGDNRHFVDRAICLGVPIFMRVCFFVSFFSLILPLEQDTVTGKILLSIFSVIFELIFFWRLWVWMGRTSGARPKN